ncbi:AAA family ATPase [Caballeronia sp. GAFFF1]|uniref:AAA family ATPase n=1 Tax=Caballeronia sp. GAFFF1 TaxID=2921779 RepID=UPI0020283B2D|nr:AAA family ATPase [Caballeronia sp. GAFFF1]
MKGASGYIPGYMLEPLRTDRDLALYKGTKVDTEQKVFVIAVAAELPTPDSVRQLEHEYYFARRLDASWAAQPLELTRLHARAALVVAYPDPQAEFLDLLLTRRESFPPDISLFLNIAIGLATAVDGLHRLRVVHKDIKPSHILVTPAGRAWLTGFGIASTTSHERQPTVPPETIAGTLAYMSPEQTGRMNRPVDCRSDLYSLGVTLFETLTGTLPFVASDPMEWVHCHVARQAVPLTELVPSVPAVISSIVTKLLAKDTDERYQTAAGLANDLQQCLKGWQLTGHVEDFTLGTLDTTSGLRIGEKLYGRESEVEVLQSCLNRAALDRPCELVLVSGNSGVGKSSLVDELQRSTVGIRSNFASAKCDQQKRDIPYAVFGDAVLAALRPLLIEGEYELTQWRETVSAALYPNGQVIMDLIPNLRVHLGEQRPVPALPPTDAKIRLHAVARRFIQALALRRPLVLFFDDLQWSDTATLDLIEDLVVDKSLTNVILLGAYRDNELPSDSPLSLKLLSLRNSAASVRHMKLEPLRRSDLDNVIADFLHCSREFCSSLSEIIHEKTNGNPFYVIQFIRSLLEDEIIKFDRDAAAWFWDLNRIRKRRSTENVADLLVDRLRRLPPRTQRIVEGLACLGSAATVEILAAVRRQSEDDIHQCLLPAVNAGLIIRLEGYYRFVHDQVREAAYRQIPDASRAERHLQIGISLETQVEGQELDQRIFDIVNQLNRGAHLVAAVETRERFAKLNVIAAARAKASTAYSSALNFVLAGRRLLNDDTWKRNPRLMFSVESLTAECEFLTGDLASAERRLSMLASHVDRAADAARVTRLRVSLYNVLGKGDAAIWTFIEYRRAQGDLWSQRPSDEQVSIEYGQICAMVDARDPKDLLSTPLLSEEDTLQLLDVLAEVTMSAMLSDPNVYALLIFRMVKLTLTEGNSGAGSFAYVSLGMLAGSRFGDFGKGYQLGKLGYDLVERYRFDDYRARVYVRFADCIMPWIGHVRRGRDLIRRAIEAAAEMSDVSFAGYSYAHLNTNLLAAGDRLADVQRQVEDGLRFAESVRFDRMAEHMTAQLMLIRTLRGLTPKFGSFDDGNFSEATFELRLSSSQALTRLYLYYVRKLQARFIAGDYAVAVEASAHADRLFWTAHSHFEAAEHQYYGALARAQLLDQLSDAQRPTHFSVLLEHARRLEQWARHCPENFGNREALVNAEIARVEGRLIEAQDWYEKAIVSARESGFIHNEAIANELASRFYESRGYHRIALAYLQDGRHCYLSWGAEGKVRQLDRSFPTSEDGARSSVVATIMAPVAVLDLSTVVKVSQALSSEIMLPRLTQVLLRMAIENGGAQRGLLILVGSEIDDLKVEAEAVTGTSDISVHLRQARMTSTDVPQSIVRYVLRTRDYLVLRDASADVVYARDEYVQRNRSRSLLCVPIVRHAKVIGVMYLENALAPDVFTADRLAILQLMASQAAISLENAKLYTDLQRSEAFLAQGQRISLTGTFGWNLLRKEYYWSDETYDLLGYDRDVRASVELAIERTHPDDQRIVRRMLFAAMREKMSFDVEHRLLMPNGEIRHVRAVGRAVDAGDLDYIGAIHDISGPTLAREALNRALSDLSRINRATTMGELTASLAHEINQPITSVVIGARACLRWLNRDEPDINEVRELVERISHDGERAGHIIDRIRAQFRKGPLDRERFSIDVVIDETVHLLKSEAARYGVVMRVERADASSIVLGDRIQVQQVISNLVINSIEAVKDHAGTREVTISSRRSDNGTVIVAVHDTGPGVPPDLVGKIFDPFFTTKTQGTGMGLRISRTIVEAHGGQLWAGEHVGTGATFLFTLPLVAP